MLQRNLDVLVLEGARDFRRGGVTGKTTWHVPADAAARHALDRTFSVLAEGVSPKTRRLTVAGHDLTIPLAADRVARGTFAALCETPLGGGDYVALATHFHALVLDDIPRLDAGHRDGARRFIILVDALYDHRVKLHASAEAALDELFTEEIPGSARAASRLVEMAAAGWQSRRHIT